MAKGLDTTVLIQAELREHPHHEASWALLDGVLRGPERLCLAPQVLAEFVHVATDSRRFTRPLSMPEALERALAWWEAREVVPVFPSEGSTALFLRWMEEHRLGRKRILDTQLAATYHCARVDTLISSNARDYGIFGCFTIIEP